MCAPYVTAKGELLFPSLHPSYTGDNGSLLLWDWKTGYNFQKHQTTVQPGSLDSEAGIFKCVFDMSGCRLLTAEADKTIKIYKEDDTAVGVHVFVVHVHVHVLSQNRLQLALLCV